MIKIKFNSSLLICLLSFVWFSALAQKNTAILPSTPVKTIATPKQVKDQNPTQKINWGKPVFFNIDENNTLKQLNFPSAAYLNEETNLPYYHQTKELGSASNIEPQLTDLTFEEIPAEEITDVKFLETLGSDINLEFNIGNFRKKPILKYWFVPLRKNSSTGKIERLISFNVNFATSAKKQINKTANSNRSYNNNSVLATGTWYKIGLAKDGIYKIDYNFLDSLGVDLAALNPKTIKLYGNGGEQLSFKNSDFRYDDLIENSIKVVGESDNKFDTSDYVLFYGQGPNKWHQIKNVSCAGRKFAYNKNYYSDSSYYFINVGGSYGKRIADQLSDAANADMVVTDFDDRQFYEKEIYNLIKSGREYYGELFDNIVSYEFPFTFNNIVSNYPVTTKINLGARCIACPGGSNFEVKGNGSLIGTANVGPVPAIYYGDNIALSSFCGTFTSSNPLVKIGLNYIKNGASIAYLNNIEVFAKRQLMMDGNQMLFRNTEAVDSPAVAQFMLTNSASSVEIWDITNGLSPLRQISNYSNFVTSFKINVDSLKEFIAFNGLNYLVPKANGAVKNQNLHGLAQADFVIVAHPLFYNDALALADLHHTHDSLNVVVATTEQIYNEFSSGGTDVTAIKDFMKMFYDRNNSGKLPKYLLLYGDGSYDNKNKSVTNTNYIPTYQSSNSISPTGSYVSEDYFGLLDDNEGDAIADVVDLGIGRLPVKNASESSAMLTKIVEYINPTSYFDPSVSQTQSCTSELSSSAFGYGDWRNTICFIADDQDANTHLNQAEQLAVMVDTSFATLNLDKIYLDAFKQTINAGGQRYPDVNDAINRRVERGALIVNYTGHGGEVGWSAERILDVTTIEAWDNKDRLPFFVTATCEFSRFDDPARNSAGELVLLNKNGGGIGLLTTTRLVYASYNFELNTSFYEVAFDTVNGKMLTIGEITMLTKRNSSPTVNNRNFTLLGDPALTLAYPKNKVVTTSINGKTITSITDTLKALSLVTISGKVTDNKGNNLNNYNGILYPTVYDKAVKVYTLANDNRANSPGDFSEIKAFKSQKSILFKGKTTVQNGNFSFQFIVPKDIAYSYDFGRISYYSENGKTDANGAEEQFYIGGYDKNAAADNEGPEVKLYLNDEKFVSGGLTNESPVILANLKDIHGINTVGNGIGHDLTAVLDENTSKSIVLNEYYESDLNSYQSGKVRYKLNDLKEGRHTIDFKAWDVYNNSTDAFTEFIVSTSANLALQHVLNYPNPFTTKTSFYFEHNKPCTNLDVQIQIFTVSGKLIKTIDRYSLCNGYRSDPIDWDGTDDFGDNIGKGVYIYRLKVRASDGDFAEKYEKLVILK